MMSAPWARVIRRSPWRHVSLLGLLIAAAATVCVITGGAQSLNSGGNPIQPLRAGAFVRGRENGVKDGGVGVRASTLTPAPPNRPVPVWPRPHYNLSGHHKQPDRPHKLQLGAASYALDPLAKVAELRVLTLQKWATSWDDQKTAGLHLRDLVDMGWQCLLCFSDPPPWGGDESGEKWGGVKVNATGDSWGHPQTETEKSKLDLSCRRFDVTRIEDVKAKYDQIVGGDFESIAYMCSVPPEILRESRRAHPGGAVHGWVSLIEGDWTRERVAEHFRGGGEEPTLDRFVALRDMTRLDVMAQPIGVRPMRISGCHTTPLYRTAGWTPLMREMLIEYLAWNKLNGMGKQRMYLLKEEEPVATWLAPLFDYFGGDGFLEVLEWRYPQVPASFFGQLLLQYDCLYRSVVDSDWTLFGDFDELVASNTVALSTWNDTFGDIWHDPTVGEIQMRSWFFLGDCATAGEGVKDLVSSQLVYRKPEAEGPHIRSKYWVRPEAATWSYIHAAGLKAGYRHVEVDPKRAHVRHYMLKRKELVGVRNCTHAALKEAGLQPEYGFALTQQERLWAEVEAARRYIDFHTNNSGLVARKAGLPGVRALEVEGSVEVQEL